MTQPNKKLEVFLRNNFRKDLGELNKVANSLKATEASPMQTPVCESLKQTCQKFNSRVLAVLTKTQERTAITDFLTEDMLGNETTAFKTYHEIPESYWVTQLADRQRLGLPIELTDSFKHRALEHIMRVKTERFQEWFYYLSHPDQDHYPIELKYWVFKGLQKMGTFDEAKGVFKKRNKNTVKPYAELMHDCLAQSIEAALEKIKNPQYIFDDSKLNKIFARNFPSFGKVYAYFISMAYAEIVWDNIEGQWIKVPKGSHPAELVDLIKEYKTGWCVRSQVTAYSYLSDGDFWVFCTEATLEDKIDPADSQKLPIYRVPRIGVATTSNFMGELARVREVRGIAKGQAMDAKITDSNALQQLFSRDEFAGKGQEFLNKDANIKALDVICKQVDLLMQEPDNRTLLLTEEQWNLVFEKEFQFQHFGHGRNPRLEQYQRKIVEVYAANKLFNKCDFEVFLHAIDLRWMNLSGANLKGANLSEAKLTGSNLAEADLTNVNLTGADLSKTDLHLANLNGATLARSTMVDLKRPPNKDCLPRGVEICRTNLTYVVLGPGMNLSNVDFSWMVLRNVDLSNATLTRANLNEIDLRGANLSGATLSKVKLNGANLAGADLRGADVLGVDLRSVNLDGAKLDSN